MKKKQNGMYGLLAVIALMLAASIYASCSSEDDDYDNGWVELETMARGTRAGNGEGGNIASDGIIVGNNTICWDDITFTDSIINDNHGYDIHTIKAPHTYILEYGCSIRIDTTNQQFDVIAFDIERNNEMEHPEIYEAFSGIQFNETTGEISRTIEIHSNLYDDVLSRTITFNYRYEWQEVKRRQSANH